MVIFEARQEAPKFGILWQNMAQNIKKIAQQRKTIEPYKILFLFIFYQWAILDSPVPILRRKPVTPCL